MLFLSKQNQGLKKYSLTPIFYERARPHLVSGVAVAAAALSVALSKDFEAAAWRRHASAAEDLCAGHVAVVCVRGARSSGLDGLWSEFFGTRAQLAR